MGVALAEISGKTQIATVMMALLGWA